jgi:hypothetical protein
MICHMRTLRIALTVAVCMKGQTAKSKLAEVDRIFAAFNTHTPGCAVGVSEHATVAIFYLQAVEQSEANVIQLKIGAVR